MTVKTNIIFYREDIMTERNVGVGCGVLLLNDKGQFLMMKRASKHATGTYAIPGGWMEFGETFERVAEREVMEELGVEIENVKVLGATNNIFPMENKHTVAIILAAKLKSGTPRIMEPDKCESIAWYDDWEQLPTPLFTDYNKYISKEQIQNYVKSNL